MKCPKDLAYKFDEPPCQNSCVEPFNNCPLPNTEICGCPNGTVLSLDGQCVPPTDCQCLDDEGNRHNVSLGEQCIHITGIVSFLLVHNIILSFQNRLATHGCPLIVQVNSIASSAIRAMMVMLKSRNCLTHVMQINSVPVAYVKVMHQLIIDQNINSL